MISRVRGTEDLLDLTLRNFCTSTIRKHLAIFNFQEIQTPIIEYTNLFVHAVGQETDIVTKEMFLIDKEKADGDKSICLRPENTASIIRACHENGIQRFPWKVFTFGPMFRYERPQKGRLRQFHQFSIEIIGTTSIAQDAHFIKMLDVLFGKTFSLNNYVIKLNFLGTVEDRLNHKQALLSFLDQHLTTICPTCLVRKDKNALRIFDCKNETCAKLYEQAPKLINYLGEESKQEWNELQSLLQQLSVNFIIEHKLVRGLDYYGKTVFEFSSSDLGAQNAFCGGGRYLLGKEVGASNDFPSIGVGIGIERLLMLLELHQDKLAIPQQPQLHMIIPMTEKQDAVALLLADNLQRHGLVTDIIFEKASMSNMMKKANKLGAHYVLTIGESEQLAGTVGIKDMLTGTNTLVAQTEAANFLKK